MGFGYLFVGYLLTFNFIAYNHYTDIFAVLLMLLGLSTLSKYAKGFKRALYVGIPLAVLSAVAFVARLGALLALFSVGEMLSTYLTVMGQLLWGVFLWFVLDGVVGISRETGIPVLTVRALRQHVMILIFFVIRILLETNVFKTLSLFLQCLMIIYVVFGLVTVFLNAKLLYECYIWICLEGEESMERRPSRFGFINKLRALEDKMDARTVERKREEQRLRAERKKEKQQRKGKKKK